MGWIDIEKTELVMNYHFYWKQFYGILKVITMQGMRRLRWSIRIIERE